MVFIVYVRVCTNIDLSNNSMNLLPFALQNWETNEEYMENIYILKFIANLQHT